MIVSVQEAVGKTPVISKGSYALPPVLTVMRMYELVSLPLSARSKGIAIFDRGLMARPVRDTDRPAARKTRDRHSRAHLERFDPTLIRSRS